MDSERVRKELRVLLAELPEERQATWRSFTDSVADAYAELQTQASDLQAGLDLATVIRDANALQGESIAVMREATTELRRRWQMPDLAQIAKIATVLAGIIGPLVGAVAYALSGGQIGTVDLPVPLPVPVPGVVP
tara:strand:+ start:1748 stop:2152 length:405 start_codon:yes stop_codon:yes gene_type:complete